MDYTVEYKNLHDIVTLINKPSKTVESNVNVIKNQNNITSVCFDVIIVFDDKKLKNILCSDKQTLQLINNLHLCDYHKNAILNKLYRCIIINYNEIIDLLSYKEFCRRYKYKI